MMAAMIKTIRTVIVAISPVFAVCSLAPATATTLRRSSSSSDHINDAGCSPSSGAGGYRSISAARAQAAADLD